MESADSWAVLIMYSLVGSQHQPEIVHVEQRKSNNQSLVLSLVWLFCMQTSKFPSRSIFRVVQLLCLMCVLDLCVYYAFVISVNA